MSFFKSKYFFDSLIALLKNKWLPFVLGIPLFFCLHHYEGIVVDAVLYLLQVIHSISPERFVNDPPFMFGNQDSLGFFTPLYKLFLDHFTIATGTKLACFLFQLIWIVSLIFLVKGIGKSLKNRLWILPITILFIGMSADRMPHYGMLFVNFVQDYNCSRLLSTALGLGGLACLFYKKKWWSLILLVIGAAVHPLSAGWGLPVWFIFFYPKTKYLITTLSAIIPFTFLLHWGPLDFLPDDWLKRPLLYRPDVWDLLRIVIYVSFLWYYVPRKTSIDVGKISRAIALILFIAYYWNIWGCFGKHILLYQLQTWRAEWLAWAAIMPFFLNILFMEARKNKSFFLFMKSRSFFVLSMLSLSLIPPVNNPFFFILAIVVESDKSRSFLKNKIKLNAISKDGGNYYVIALACILVLWCIVSIVYTDAVQLALEGSLPMILLGGNFQIEDAIIRSNLMSCALLSLVFALLSISQKKWLSLGCFCVYVFFPFLLLVPLFGLVLFFFNLGSIRNKFIAIVVFILCVVDGTFATQLRGQFFFEVFSEAFKPVFILWAYVSFFLVLLNVLKQRFLKGVLGMILIASISTYAFCFWDGRSVEKKQTEATIELYKDKIIFESIQNRGKMFFYVTGSLVDMPRLQFLTGAYLSYNTHMGEIFYKKQFLEAQKRDNNLFYKRQMGKAHEKIEYRNFVTGPLSNRDTLIDRIDYLCKIEEISHLVSDIKNMPYHTQDSIYINMMNKEIYLYRCPNS